NTCSTPMRAALSATIEASCGVMSNGPRRVVWTVTVCCWVKVTGTWAADEGVHLDMVMARSPAAYRAGIYMEKIAPWIKPYPTRLEGQRSITQVDQRNAR